MKCCTILNESCPRAVAGALMLASLAAQGASSRAQEVAAVKEVMPHAEDYAHMWWAEGFPSHTPEAPWLRVIQTGSYALALDTQALRIPHFGAVPAGVDYAECARSDNRAWQRLPPADLALAITVNGKIYRCAAGGTWTPLSGPRLIESGRFMQRADVTDLNFAAGDGSRLNTEARFETVAWPDRLGLILAARPGLQPIPAGEPCFGRVGGGFGLDGTNHFEIPHAPETDPERFTLDFWAYVPEDFRASQRTPPWLVCKGPHEQAEGNYGITLFGENPQARINIGGGRENAVTIDSRPGLMKVSAWNHFALSYDGQDARLYVNGTPAGERQIGRKRASGAGGLAFGRRQDNCGDGYHFRGVIDEIRLYDRALTAAEVQEHYLRPERANPDDKPLREWRFRPDGKALPTQPRASWKASSSEIVLTVGDRQWKGRADWGAGSGCEWQEASVSLGEREIREATGSGVGAALQRLLGGASKAPPPVTVQAHEIANGVARPVTYDAARSWHRVNLDGIEPLLPACAGERGNDALERVRLVLSNPADCEQPVRLLFEKTGPGMRQRLGASITGVSAVLRDAAGHPSGIPVQLSKNWHGRPEDGVHAGAWFHGFSLMRLPPKATAELELTLAYGHWGGVAAASHAQLCLIGWGSNQLWDQSALGSWGESICYEPDQAQAQAAILDVRPVMVRSMNGNAQWGWTHNVGGGDFFRLFDVAGKRVFPSRMRTAYVRQGPCLTEVTYAGHLGEGVEHTATVSLGRSDDLVRGVYRLRLDVSKPVGFARFVLFQIGADTYSYTGERKMALGNETGLLKEWETRWGGDTVRVGPLECSGRLPWISLHEAVARRKADKLGAWANRGIVIRSWRARLGGKAAAPWVVERGVSARGSETSTADIVPPPGITRLEPGDFVEATFEHVVMPQFAEDYYGPNDALRAALAKDANTWRMICREAVGNDRRIAMKKGALEGEWPAVSIRTVNGAADFTLTGGLGYVPVTFSGLTDPAGYAVSVDGRTVDQSVHGKDFWQADYTPSSKRWSRTYNLPVDDSAAHAIRFERARD